MTTYHDSPLPKTSSWMENCTKFGQLILSKIIKIVATSCQISRLKCTKFDFGWGSAYSAPPGPLAELRGPTSKGREGREREGKGGEETGGRRGRGEGCPGFAFEIYDHLRYKLQSLQIAHTLDLVTYINRSTWKDIIAI